MTIRMIAMALMALTLSACNTMGCDASSNNGRGGGECGTHISFLR
jgi:predicted small secreted protein